MCPPRFPSEPIFPKSKTEPERGDVRDLKIATVLVLIAAVIIAAAWAYLHFKGTL